MEDRTPKYPGRIKLTPVPGQADTYDMIRADEATQAGTPMNKATFLKDTTAALFEMGADAVPDEIFQKIRAIFNDVDVDINGLNNSIITLDRTKPEIYIGTYVGTGLYGEDNPVKLSFPFAPKMLLVIDINGSDHFNTYHEGWVAETSVGMTTTYQVNRNPVGYADSRSSYGVLGKISSDGKTWYWCTRYNDAGRICNVQGLKYGYIAIG